MHQAKQLTHSESQEQVILGLFIRTNLFHYLDLQHKHLMLLSCMIRINTLRLCSVRCISSCKESANLFEYHFIHADRKNKKLHLFLAIFDIIGRMF